METTHSLSQVMAEDSAENLDCISYPRQAVICTIETICARTLLPNEFAPHGLGEPTTNRESRTCLSLPGYDWSVYFTAIIGRRSICSRRKKTFSAFLT